MIVIHHNDIDGRCSAAIVKYYDDRREPQNDITFIEMDYSMEVPFDKIKQDEAVIIVDFSLKPKQMEKLREITEVIIWIDHHKTAAEYPYQDLAGIRNFNDKEMSGCELTWQYYFSMCGPAMPKAVKLIGDYDKWALKMQPECFEFYEGLKMTSQNPTEGMWPCLFENDSACDMIIEQGQFAISYRDSYCLDMLKGYGYKTEIDGQMAIALNLYRFGSKQFGDAIKKYPVLIAYIHNGENFTVSLYSEKVDVSEIAKNHGGGGHQGAAGFVCKELPFNRIA